MPSIKKLLLKSFNKKGNIAIKTMFNSEGHNVYHLNSMAVLLTLVCASKSEVIAWLHP
jgi:hypothetical protein